MEEQNIDFELEDVLLDDNVESIFKETLSDDIEELAEELDDVQQPQQNIDGKIEITIDDDEMAVYANIYPPVGNGIPITTFKVYDKLFDLGVVDPLICKTSVEESIQRVNTSLRPVKKVLIAEGQIPSPYIPSYIVITHKKENPQDADKKDETKSIDYKKQSSILLVKKGTVIAKKIDAIEGQKGMTVKGEVLDVPQARVKEIRLGKHTVLLANNDIASTVHGEMVINRNELSVNNVLTLKEGVNYKTGHIKFPGTVMIKGEVESGFNILVQENLHIHNTLAAFNVYVGGDLFVKGGGIIGQNNSKVKVVKSLTTDFVERVLIEILGDIHIKKAALHAQIRSNGAIKLGKQGKIIGCTVHARNGIEVDDIGNNSDNHASIFCGTDFMAENKLLLINKHRERLQEEKEKALLMDKHSDVSDFESGIMKCNLASQQILMNMVYNEEAKVHVRGTVYPGTEINICHIKYTVTNEMKRGFFFLSKEDGSIHFEAK